MIRNLLFDLGGVIMDLHRADCCEAFRSLGFADIDSYLGDYGQQGMFARLEEGAISPEEFRAEVRTHLSVEASDEQIDEAFNRFLAGIPVCRLQHLRRLHQSYRIYLLSNTNAIMWHSDIARHFRSEGLTINDYFDGIITSFEAGCCKPSPDIFRYTAGTLDILPEETIFFDDSAANCEAAAALGFATRHVAPGNEFYELF